MLRTGNYYWWHETVSTNGRIYGKSIIGNQKQAAVLLRRTSYISHICFIPTPTKIISPVCIDAFQLSSQALKFYSFVFVLEVVSLLLRRSKSKLLVTFIKSTSHFVLILIKFYQTYYLFRSNNYYMHIFYTCFLTFCCWKSHSFLSPKMVQF